MRAASDSLDLRTAIFNAHLEGLLHGLHVLKGAQPARARTRFGLGTCLDPLRAAPARRGRCCRAGGLPGADRRNDHFMAEMTTLILVPFTSLFFA